MAKRAVQYREFTSKGRIAEREVERCGDAWVILSVEEVWAKYRRSDRARAKVEVLEKALARWFELRSNTKKAISHYPQKLKFKSLQEARLAAHVLAPETAWENYRYV